MTKTNRPTAQNPLANMGLDDIVRGITTPSSPTPEAMTEDPSPSPEGDDVTAKSSRQRRGGMKELEEYIAKFKRLNEQGAAIWIPTEVKKRLELIKINSSRRIPTRALAAAIIMTYINQNEERISKL